MNIFLGRMWREAALFVVGILVIGAVFFVVTGQPQPPAPEPLQSPIDTVVPTAPVSIPTPDPGATATPLTVPTVAETPTSLLTPFGTPDMRSTSLAVIATLTAQAIPPTFPPIPTPRPIGAGPEQPIATSPPTSLPPADSSGITLLSLSDRVYAGGAVALTIRTQPNAICQLHITRTQVDGNVSTTPIVAGVTRRASSDGTVAWIWAVDADEPGGPAALLVSCDGVGSAQYQIEVVK